MSHTCDAATDPRGGLLTLQRVYRAILASLDSRPPDVIGEIDECQRCRVLFAITLAGLTARAVADRGPDVRMGFELALAGVQAALDRGETETTR